MSPMDFILQVIGQQRQVKQPKGSPFLPQRPTTSQWVGPEGQARPPTTVLGVRG